MHILVTGGAGFIGSHTCVALQAAGCEITVADNFSNSSPESLRAVEKITGKSVACCRADLLDADALERLFAQNHFDGVIHFAGWKAVGESVEIPLTYYYNNVAGTVNLLRAMDRHDCRTIVFSSSATVYGAENPIPYVETMPRSAASPYGRTKVMIEQILEDLCAADERWSALLLRYFNPIGAHESGLIGEAPNGIPNNLVPYIARVAAGSLPALGVFGNDYPTPDGTGVRDYIHVMDLAQGHVAALQYALSHKGAEPVNLGTGHGSSVLEVVRAYEKACGRAIPCQIKPRRRGDIAAFYADTTKAARLLDWRAARTLEDMCRDSWHFTKKHLD